MRGLMLAAPVLLLAGCGGGSVVINAENAATVAAENGAAALPPAPAPKAFPKLLLGDFDLNQLIRAFGTEPFWTLDMGPGTFSYTDYSVDEPKAAPFYWADPVIAGDTATYTTKNVAGDVVVLTLTRKDCLEVGEEDQKVPLTAELKIGSKTLHGCAGPKPADEPDEEMENVTKP